MDKFQKKREEIKNAGMKMFATYGYYKTTLEDIAGVIGMKKNSLYYYFESKEALFRELVKDEITVHRKFMEKILSQDLTAEQKLLKIISGLGKFIYERTLKYSVKLSTYLEISKVIKSQFKDFTEHECLTLESILKEGIKGGEFVKHNTKQLAKDLEYLVPALFRSYYTDSEAEFVHEINFKELFTMINRLITYIINGIKLNKK